MVIVAHWAGRTRVLALPLLTAGLSGHHQHHRHEGE